MSTSYSFVNKKKASSLVERLKGRLVSLLEEGKVHKRNENWEKFGQCYYEVGKLTGKILEAQENEPEAINIPADSMPPEARSSYPYLFIESMYDGWRK